MRCTKMAKSEVAESTIEAIYTVSPNKIRNSSQPSCKVVVPNQPLHNHDILQKRMQIVAFFKNKTGGDSGWHVGGWIKETLGMALEENPVFAGRLRRSEDGNLEIVCNDSGVRCIEAEMALSLVDFLETNEKTQVEPDQLAHWIDIDEKTPQFSPLLYIQVTNFKCGGYSVGLSYSLLLADPFLMAQFFTKWADIHRITAYEGEIPKISLFHTPTMGRNMLYPPLTTQNHPKNTVFATKTPPTVIFNVSTAGADAIPGVGIALVCIREAETKLGRKMSSYFTLITKEPSRDTKIEVTKNTFEVPKGVTYEINELSWKDLRNNDISFRKMNVPVDVAHWVSSDALQGMVLIVGSTSTLGHHKYGMNVFVTFPNEEFAS